MDTGVLLRRLEQSRPVRPVVSWYVLFVLAFFWSIAVRRPRFPLSLENMGCRVPLAMRPGPC